MGCDLAVEHLPIMHVVLGLIPSPHPKPLCVCAA